MNTPSEQKQIVIGSRGSDLALWQAHFIKKKLEQQKLSVEIKIIKTQGDKIQDLSFDKLEGKGFFTKELEEALLNKEIDLAVHSHKDLPTTAPEGLSIAAVSYREDPSELLLINKNAVDSTLKYSIKKNAIVGTSSARRKSQLLAFRNDVEIKELRGNVPTRIQKLKDKQYDAIMLAAAGVERLNIDLTAFHVEKLNPKEFIPAPAQGVLALQIRSNDAELANTLQAINDTEVAATIAIERKVLNLFDGGCQLPLGVYCETTENEHEEIIYNVWISKADTWNGFPKQLFLASKNNNGFAEKIVEKINAVKPKSVFLTRDKRKNDYFLHALSTQGFNVHQKSLIDIKPIAFKAIPKTDWIFFSSKNAVKYFFALQPIIDGIKLAAVSKSTADELRRLNKKADFIGYSTDTRLTGKQFAAVVGSKSVLFPQAKGSLKSIQKQFTKPGQAHDLIVYETIKNNTALDFNMADMEVLVFTSPSNVDTFFEKHKIEKHQKVIAMGDATAHTLKNHGIKTDAMPASFDDIGLVQAVLSV